MSQNEILDQSKGDGCSKTITTVQLAYFVASLCARTARNLPISQLEILTLAFAVFAVLAYFALWNKPQGVNVPTTIQLDKLHEPMLRNATNMMGSVQSGDVKKPFTAEKLIARSEPEMDSVYMTIIRVTLPHEVFLAPAILTLIIAGFAGFHFLAWDYEFPSTAEQVIWRVAAVTTLSSPFALYVLTNCVCCMRCLQHASIWITFIAVYGLARLLLVVIAFTSLRSLPSEAYLTTWSGYVPHFQ